MGMKITHRVTDLRTWEHAIRFSIMDVKYLDHECKKFKFHFFFLEIGS